MLTGKDIGTAGLHRGRGVGVLKELDLGVLMDSVEGMLRGRELRKRLREGGRRLSWILRNKGRFRGKKIEKLKSRDLPKLQLIDRNKTKDNVNFKSKERKNLVFLPNFTEINKMSHLHISDDMENKFLNRNRNRN